MNEWIIIVGLVAIIIMLVMTFSSRIHSLERQVKSLRNRVKQVANQVDVPEPIINERLRALLEDEKYVQAVKEAREALGLSLVEAKQYVDEL